MSIHDHHPQVLAALSLLPDLTALDRAGIAALRLPVYDSIVVGHLRRAYHLLARDGDFNWELRELTWHAWQTQMSGALEDSLRLRKNEPLIVALGVCASLFPLAHQGAGLMGYKTINDAVTLAQRGGFNPKRERVNQPLRIKDWIERVPLWVTPAGEISDAEVDGSIETSGCALRYLNPEPVLEIVGCVLPIRVGRDNDRILIAVFP